MRWLLAVGGALALMAAAYLGLRPRLTRPVLRVGFTVRSGSSEAQAVEAGVALALDERDERGGRYRVTVISTDQDSVKLDFKNWMPGLDSVPDGWLDESGAALIAPDVNAQADVLLAWAKAKGLRRVAVPASRRPEKREDDSNSGYASLGLRPNLGTALEKRMPAGDLLWPSAEGKADLIWLDSEHGLVWEARTGFGGPIFLAAAALPLVSLNPAFDGCLTVLAPLRAPPPGFRHPSPFAYAGYLGALRFLDALDADPLGDPKGICLPWVFDELRGEPRVYEIRGGRFIPK